MQSGRFFQKCFSSKFATKFLGAKTVSGKVVRHSLASNRATDRTLCIKETDR